MSILQTKKYTSKKVKSNQKQIEISFSDPNIGKIDLDFNSEKQKIQKKQNELSYNRIELKNIKNNKDDNENKLKDLEIIKNREDERHGLEARNIENSINALGSRPLRRVWYTSETRTKTVYRGGIGFLDWLCGPKTETETYSKEHNNDDEIRNWDRENANLIDLKMNENEKHKNLQRENTRKIESLKRIKAVNAAQAEKIQKEIQLSDVISIINKRNKNDENIPVLSISNKFGFISQTEQFEDREVASSDKKNYKIVNKGEFAYNPARINVGSIAQLKNYEKGIISPMYIVFKVDSNVLNQTYFENFLDSDYFRYEMMKRLEGSVRMILSADSLKNIKITIPSIDEQEKLSKVFLAFDKKIKITKYQLDKTQEFKKGLLQQMFVVRINWRCNFKLAKSPSFNKHLLILKNKIIFIIIELIIGDLFMKIEKDAENILNKFSKTLENIPDLEETWYITDNLNLTREDKSHEKHPEKILRNAHIDKEGKLVVKRADWVN